MSDVTCKTYWSNELRNIKTQPVELCSITPGIHTQISSYIHRNLFIYYHLYVVTVNNNVLHTTDKDIKHYRDVPTFVFSCTNVCCNRQYMLHTINKDIKHYRDVLMYILSCTNIFSTVSSVGSKVQNTVIVGVWTG